VRKGDPRFWNWLAAVLLVSGVYSALHTFTRWIPHDEGVLAQMAERALSGELPHADFDEIYSGGLTFLNALSFVLFGARLSSMRITLFVFHLGFLASLFSIATRAARPPVAALFTLLCLSWGLPNYFAALPSWYLLMFAIYGTHATVRYVETEREGWVVLAGFVGGVSCLFKVAGVYYLLALLLFLVYREQLRAEGAGVARSRSLATSLSVLLVLACPVILLLGLTWARLDAMEAIYFVLPGTAVCLLLAWNELRSNDAGHQRLRRTARAFLHVGLGAAAPVLVFLVPYLLRNDLHSLYRGLFVLPQRRYDFAFYPLPPPWALLATLPIAAIVCLPIVWRPRASWVVVGAVIVPMAAVVSFGFEQPIYRWVWYSVRPLGPFAAMLTCALPLLGRREPAPTMAQRQLLFLMGAMAAFVSVVQFPYSFGVYFWYAAPPIALAILFATTYAHPTSWSRIHLCLLLFYLAFGVLWLNTGNVRTTGVLYLHSDADQLLLPERANLRVRGSDKEVYETLVHVIDRLAGGDPYIMATPDCPEVYFLSRRKNPTRVLHEFLDPVKPTPRQLLEQLTTKGVRVVVLNSRPEFSQPVSHELYATLTEVYSQHTDVGWFRVLWKD
jgi:dolichyl-phosphate-mannose-protein mannosyltransferase